jgi:hypothetical protein
MDTNNVNLSWAQWAKVHTNALNPARTFSILDWGLGTLNSKILPSIGLQHLHRRRRIPHHPWDVLKILGDFQNFPREGDLLLPVWPCLKIKNAEVNQRRCHVGQIGAGVLGGEGAIHLQRFGVAGLGAIVASTAARRSSNEALAVIFIPPC